MTELIYGTRQNKDEVASMHNALQFSSLLCEHSYPPKMTLQ